MMTFIDGVLIGIANIIPGVSGGTFALILGIFDRLVAAINNLSPRSVQIAWRLLARRFDAASRQEAIAEWKRLDASFLVLLGLGAVAYHEFKGRRMLRALDVRGPRLLGFNQIGFGVVIVGYCVWNLVVELAGPGAYAQTIEEHPELGEILGSTDGLYRMAVVLVYGTVIVLTIPYQALMAWYYFSRSKHLETYIRQTPGWVTDLERAAA